MYTNCTTGCSIVQPVGQPVASCKQTSNRFDYRLFRINGVEGWHGGFVELMLCYVETPFTRYNLLSNRFTSGGVIAERVNTVETRDKVYPILDEAIASRRVISKIKASVSKP